MRGSPPRVRGKVLNGEIQDGVVRITPASAGKSRFLPAYTIAIEDHPRVCGEKFGCPCVHRICGGSPPRVRGKVPESQSAHSGRRITPACAGKSHHPKCRGKRTGDHPRVGGEK